MVTLNAQIIKKKERKKSMPSYPTKNLLKVQELNNYDDLRCLREATELNNATIGIDELKNRIAGLTSRSTGSPKKRASR